MAASILLVEDDENTRVLYEEIFKKEGYELTVAVDGESAVSLALRGSFNLILLDIMLPKRDGFSVLEELSKDTEKKYRVVMLTNLSHDSATKQARNLGALGYIVKSAVTPQKLLEEVKKYTVK
ncbi:response regulator [Candidatus Gottesmanbacteria bacterium]|nr:response regulator [Candidatus Gottesmanbacteria bacterium]